MIIKYFDIHANEVVEKIAFILQLSLIIIEIDIWYIWKI